MRVKANSSPRGGVQTARQRAIAHGGTNSVAVVVAGILAAAAGLAASGAAHGQAASAAATAPSGTTAGTSSTGLGSAATSESLQEVVVTATASRVKMLDASYNVVSANADVIKRANPLSAADILKVSPGLWPEASGGQTGANIEVAGFPSGGDSPFFTNMIEGMPLYGMPNLSFMDSSSLFRLDNTIQRVEVVQGGPGALLGPAQMGASANYILKTGDTAPGGQASATYGSEGLWRGDSYYGFQIADGWYGSVGGFYRVSKGVRAPQYPSDEGGQFTATLKHDLDGGSVTFWGRVLDDKNQFIAPIPVIENSIGSFSAYPGFNPLTATYGSYANENVSVPGPFGNFESASLGNGRGTQMYFFGSNYDQTIGGWTFHNGFIADGGGLDTNAFFSGPNPRPLSYYLYGCQVPEPAGYCNGTTAVDTNNLGTNGQGLPLADNIQAIYATNGQPVPLSTSVIQQGWWFIQKSLQNFADEFRLSREVFTGNTLTGGMYLAVYEDNDKWSLGNQMLMTNTNNATPIDLSYVAGANTYNLTSPQGFVNDNGNFDIAEHGNARNIAGYLLDSWKMGPWLIQTGARLENINAHQRTCNTTAEQLGTAYDLWDNQVPVCNGTWDWEHYVRTRPTFTGGINYDLAANMSAYLRLNNGVHFDDFDNGIRQADLSPTGFAPLQTVHNYEVGFKWQPHLAYMDISAYSRTFSGLQASESTPTGEPIPGKFVTYGSQTYGVDFDGYIGPLDGLSLRLVADYMHGVYQHDSACFPYTNIYGAAACASFNGAPIQRQPNVHLLAQPSYSVAVPWGDVSAWVNVEYVGKRYEDQAGLEPLGSYTMLGGGLDTDIGDHWELTLQGTNLTNTIALTEGNARIFGAAQGLGGVLLGRPFPGREVNVTANYKF